MSAKPFANIRWAQSQADIKNPVHASTLLAVAIDSDPKGVCWPSQDRIATFARYSVRAVRMALTWLEKEGYLRREKRFRKDGSRTSDRLILCLKRGTGRQDTSGQDLASGTSDADHRNPTAGERPSDSRPSSIEEPPEGPNEESGGKNPDVAPDPRHRSRDSAPKGAPPPRAVLCPDDFLPEGCHYAAASAAGFDDAFTRQTAAKMHRWSHTNAHRPIARKSDWPLAFDAFLETEIREARERAARAARFSSSAPAARRRSSHGGLSLAAELMGMPNDTRDILDTLDLGLGPARAAAPAYGEGRSAHPYLLEQA